MEAVAVLGHTVLSPLWTSCPSFSHSATAIIIPLFPHECGSVRPLSTNKAFGYTVWWPQLRGDEIRHEGGFGPQSCKSFLHACPPPSSCWETVAIGANWLKALSKLRQGNEGQKLIGLLWTRRSLEDDKQVKQWMNSEFCPCITYFCCQNAAKEKNIKHNDCIRLRVAASFNEIQKWRQTKKKSTNNTETKWILCSTWGWCRMFANNSLKGNNDLGQVPVSAGRLCAAAVNTSATTPELVWNTTMLRRGRVHFMK